jgi:hypothetical protein
MAVESMSTYSAIADTGSTIIKLLRDNMCPEPVPNQESILMCPATEKGDYLLGLHLYDIQESGDYRQVNMVNVSERIRRHPPLALTLFYMLTVNSTAHISSKSIDEQRILGRAMQILYDYPIIVPSASGNDNGNVPPIGITPHSMTYEEKSRIWSSLNVPSRLALYYKVSPIIIDSTRTVESSPVTSIDIIWGKKE